MNLSAQKKVMIIRILFSLRQTANYLPEEILQISFSFLNKIDLIHASQVSTSWRKAVRQLLSQEVIEYNSRNIIECSDRDTKSKDIIFLHASPFFSFSFSNCALCDPQLEIISTFSKINYLDLSRNSNITIEGLKYLAVGQLTSLKTLNIKDATIDGSVIEVILGGNFTSLTSLNLNGNACENKREKYLIPNVSRKFNTFEFA